MSLNYIFLNKSGDTCSSMNGLSSTYCLPIVRVCTEPDDDGFVFLCDRKPCDVNCAWEDATTIPFIRGDKIIFQLQFRDKANTDPKNPTLGWGDWINFELYNGETGNLITSSLGHAAISRYFVCHNGKNSYQQIEIDTNAPGLPCAFFLKFIAYDGTGGEALVVGERCSHLYREAHECEETHIVEGVYNNFDCVGNWYGEPTCEDGDQAGAEVFKYSNKTRIEASLKKLTPETENENNKNSLIDNYEFTTKSAKNPGRVFLHNYLLSWYTNILMARRIKLDDNLLRNISNFAVNYDRENPNSAVAVWSWQIKCDNCNNG